MLSVTNKPIMLSVANKPIMLCRILFIVILNVIMLTIVRLMSWRHANTSGKYYQYDVINCKKLAKTCFLQDKVRHILVRFMR
jgi:hypothetical protein